jgi:hypothetical protein
MKSLYQEDYLAYDRARKSKERRARIIRKITNGTLTAVLFAVALYVFYIPLIQHVLAGGVEKIQEPQEITKEQKHQAIVLLEVKVDWTQERIIDEIQEVFPNEPLMVKVALCEGVKNGKLDPEVVNPTNGSNDTGIFQISKKYHAEAFKALGYDDMTDPAQNIAYAHHLYETQGLKPWSASKNCWSK